MSPATGLVDVLDTYREMLRTCDDGVARAVAAMPEQPSCREGCAPCCHQYVLISLIDAMILYDRLLAENRWDGLREPLRLAGEAMIGQSRAAWFAQYRPCVLLQDQRCSVYTDRQPACRYQFALDDPQHCHPSFRDEIRTLDMQSVHNHLGVYNDRLVQALRLPQDQQYYYLPLPLAVWLVGAAVEDAVTPEQITRLLLKRPWLTAQMSRKIQGLPVVR